MPSNAPQSPRSRARLRSATSLPDDPVPGDLPFDGHGSGRRTSTPGPVGPTRRAATLHVDCDRCRARGPACEDCLVGVLLGPPGAVELDADEQSALAALASSGLVPPLRLVPGARGRAVPTDPGPLPFDGA